MRVGDSDRGPATRSRERRTVPQPAQSRRLDSPPARTLSPPNPSPMTSPRRPSSNYAWPPTPPSETQSSQTQPTIKARLRSRTEACYFAQPAPQPAGAHPRRVAAASESNSREHQRGVSSAGVAPSCEASNDGQRQRAGSGAVSSQNAPRSWATDR